MKIGLVRGARLEYFETFTWYEKQRPGLGHDFEHEFQKLLRTIQENPRRYALFEENTRKGRLKRFPYFVYFAAFPDRIDVIAIVHCKRNPEWIKQRIR